MTTPTTTTFSSMTWNARDLTKDDRWAGFIGSNALTHAIIYLQEVRVSQTRKLDASSPGVDRYSLLERRGYSGILAYDCGVLFRPKGWTMKSYVVKDTYVMLEVTGEAPMLPANHPATTLFLISLHFPTTTSPTLSWPEGDNPLPRISSVPDSAIIIGADWNMMVSFQLDSARFVPRDKVVVRGRKMLAAAREMAAIGLVDWYRMFDEEGREHSRIAYYGSDHATSGRRLDSIWGPGSLVDAIESVRFIDTTSDHRMVQYQMRVGQDVDLGPINLPFGAPRWRQHPGVLASGQYQRSLMAWAGSFMRQRRIEGRLERWEDFHRRLKHVAYYLGLPSGRAHRQAALEADALREAMAQLDLTSESGVQQHRILGPQLQHAERAAADRMAMGVQSGHANIFRESSWVADASRAYAQAIIPCLLDESSNEVRDLVAVAKLTQRLIDRLYLVDAPAPAAADAPALIPESSSGLAAPSSTPAPLAAADVAGQSQPLPAAGPSAPPLSSADLPSASTTAGPSSAAAAIGSAPLSAAIATAAGLTAAPTSLPAAAAGAGTEAPLVGDDPSIAATVAAAPTTAQPPLPVAADDPLAPAATAAAAPTTAPTPLPAAADDPPAPAATAAAASTPAITRAEGVAELHAFKELRRLSAAQRTALDAYFTEDEITAALEDLRFDAAPGLDGLPAAVYYLVKEACVPLLADLANALMDGAALSKAEASFRAGLKHKAGDKRDFANYRLVFIPDMGRKIVGHALGKRLSKIRGFWPDYQHSWVEGSRSADSLAKLQMVINRIRDGKDPPALMFVFDFEKATDRVDHGWLGSSLEHYGFGPKLRAMVRGMLANAHVSCSVNGWHTETKLERGLPQGDPATPFLFLASLQPLLDGFEAAGVGITLGATRHGPQLDVPCLAYGDDVVTFARLPEQIDAIVRKVGCYSAGAGARVSATKTKVIVLAPPGPRPAFIAELLAKLSTSCDWPAEDPDEIVHVGHPINLPVGNVARGALASSLATVKRLSCQAKVEGTALTTRIRAADTRLLPRLWPSMLFGPHPTDFLGQVLELFARYIWLGNKSWVRAEILVAPPELGGLGLHDPDRMVIAMTGGEIVRWLRRDDDAGDFFRRCLHDWLEDQGLSEAVLLLHCGKTFNTKIGNRFVAQRSFWGNIVWTLAKLGVDLIRDWSKWTLKNLLLAPYAHPAFGDNDVFRTIDGFVNGGQKHHFFLWGHIVWFFGMYSLHGSSHPSQTLPLSPPPAHALKLHKHNLPCRDAPYTPVRRIAGVLLREWNRWFPTLPEEVKRRLHDAPREFGIQKDLYKDQYRYPRCHTRPFDWDLSALDFPWHLCTIAGMTLEEYTVSGARAFLAPKKPIRPDWKLEGGEEIRDADLLHMWHHCLAKKLCLDDHAHSRLMLFQHNRARAAERFLDDARPQDHEDWELSDDPASMLRYLPQAATGLTASMAVDVAQASAPQLGAAAGGANVGAAAPPAATSEAEGDGDRDAEEDAENAGITAIDPNDPDLADDDGEQAPGAIDDAPLDEKEVQLLPEAKRTFLRGLCPSAGCEHRDSTIHGFLACPEVQKHVWTPCQQMLSVWLGDFMPSIDFKDILLCWPNAGLSPARRWRLALWRALVIDHIAKTREAVIAKSIEAGARRAVNWSGPREAKAVHGALTTLITSQWRQKREGAEGVALTPPQQEFLATFVDHTSLFAFDGISVDLGSWRPSGVNE